MKVYQLAKELGLGNKDLLDKLKALNIPAKSHLSVLDEDSVEKLKKTLKKKTVKCAAKAEKKTKTPKKPKPEKAEKLTKKPEAEQKLSRPKPKAKVGSLVQKEIKEEPAPAIKEMAVSIEKKEELITAASQEKIEVESFPTIAQPKEIPVAKVEVKEEKLKEVELSLPISIKDLSIKIQQKPSLLIKKLMEMKIMAGINQLLDEELATKICQAFGYGIKKAPTLEEELLSLHQQPDLPENLKPRPPVVTLMGHVDHGKTSLLDAIRKSQVAEKEYGGITQHIGAYKVITPNGRITFLDTPGHEAFTAMRARGARCTDIVVLVVAADDGVMPQTIEAIDHAKVAGVPIVVALNKIDKPQADIDRVKKQLSEYGLLAEDWGGKTIMVGVSAKTGSGINELLEMILLEAEMLELKANYEKLASGVVLEGKISKGRGPVATLLVQNGTLHLGDNILAGKFFGKIRSMHDDLGHPQKIAQPSSAVEVSGLSGVPEAGEQFFVVEDEKIIRQIALKRQEQDRQKELKISPKISLEDLYKNIKEGKLKELNLILKADVQGSLEAIKEAIAKLNISEIQIKIIHEGLGLINASDVILASASNALILGFHVDMDEPTKEMAAKEGVDVRIYNVIYELTNDLKIAMEGMLAPKIKKVFQGRAEVRKVFKLSRAGTIAGCFVVKGRISRNADVALLRNGEIIFEGKLSSLKHFKDDIREAQEGSECGMSLGGYEGIQEGDIIEAYEIQQIARKL